MRINSSVAAMRRSRVLKLVVALGAAATIASVGISGCHDRLPTEPLAVAPSEPAASRYPTEEEYAEMPPEFRSGTEIIAAWADAGFVSNRAYGSAGMEYFANYAKIILPVTLLFNNSQVTKTMGYEEEAYFLPMRRSIGAMASMGVTGSCGHLVNADPEFYIHNQFPLSKSGWFQWGQKRTTQHASASQPACSCTEATSLQEAAYDPYSQDGGDNACVDNGSTGGEASGIQYYAGDNTGGETVDWNTGVGNGGSSVCGATAVVEYVCLEKYNWETGRWEHFDCGFATTC